jgi:hypothetical protein
MGDAALLVMSGGWTLSFNVALSLRIEDRGRSHLAHTYVEVQSSTPLLQMRHVFILHVLLQSHHTP